MTIDPNEPEADGAQDSRAEVEPQNQAREVESQEQTSEVDVSSPAKVMRIGTMVKQLLDEVRSTDLDEKGRERLAKIHRRSIEELEDGLSKELIDELERLDLPFDTSDGPPTNSELRIAQAQLVGWLEGLFHGIQTAIAAQQAMARQELAGRGQLPPGMVAPTAGAAGHGAQAAAGSGYGSGSGSGSGSGEGADADDEDDNRGTGNYL